MKGFFKGEPQAQIASVKLRTRQIWDCFNSYDPVNVWEGITKIKVKKPEMELRFDEGEGEVVPPNEYAPQEGFFDRMGIVGKEVGSEQ
jgi:hypothetical protein